jgi:uncharacterized repeat protein (TIGR01451 family)
MGTVKPDATGRITNHACGQISGQETSDCRDDEPDEVGCSGGAHLTLVKTAPASAKPGQRITYTLTVTNQGTCPATGVVLKDPIPANFQAVGTSGCVIESGTIVCALLDLAPQASTMVSLPFDVLETCAPAIVNKATISANEEGPVSSNTVSTAIMRVADVMVMKTGPASVQPGGLVPYVLTVKNLGPDIACGVVVNDPIPAGLTSPVFPSPPCSFTPNGILCSLGNLPVGPSLPPISLSFTAPAICGNPITNKATVSAVPPTADPNPANDSGTVTTACCEDLSITKTASRATASPGDVLTYTIVVSNPGGSQATVTDVFPAGLTQVRWCKDVNGPCAPIHLGDLHDLLSDTTATYRVQATVSPMFLGTLVNTATVAGPGCDLDPSNNSATAMTEVSLAPGVAIFCKGIDGSQVEGGTVTYTFLLLNGGPAAQLNATFSDLLPAGLTPTATSASSGTVSMPPGNPVTWNGPIPVGGMVTITITAMIGPMTKGMTFCNAPTVAFDRDGDAINESVAFAIPCCFLVPQVIPTLSDSALGVLALLLTLTALRRLRRRPSP